MADDNQNYTPMRRSRPGQGNQRPSPNQLQREEDDLRERGAIEPKIAYNSGQLILADNKEYQKLMEDPRANMAAINKMEQEAVAKAQGTLNQLGTEDRAIAFGVADTINDVALGRTESNQRVKTTEQPSPESGQSTIAETLAKALGQDTLNNIKALFSDKNYAFTDLSSGNTVAPSSNQMTAEKMTEIAQQTGQGV